MNKNEAAEVLQLLDAIIKKLGCAIGKEFSQTGSDSLLQEVEKFRKNIEEIINRNTIKEK